MSRNRTALDLITEVVREDLERRPFGLIVLGLCGAPGSGKSTLSEKLAARFLGYNVPTAILSLDDLYLGRVEREQLSKLAHPLLKTRGVPGTHDIELGLEILAGMDAGEPVRLPRFDKSADDRVPMAKWPLAVSGTRLLIIEGWCVGARPQDDGRLQEPISDFERAQDPLGVWRRYINQSLTIRYQLLFKRLDTLVLLAAPDFDVVRSWRQEQEHDLIRRTGRGMSDAEVEHFVLHYERVSREILHEMPNRSDLVIWLDKNRQVSDVRRN